MAINQGQDWHAEGTYALPLLASITRGLGIAIARLPLTNPRAGDGYSPLVIKELTDTVIMYHFGITPL
jgi:hypothetical protein